MGGGGRGCVKGQEINRVNGMFPGRQHITECPEKAG